MGVCRTGIGAVQGSDQGLRAQICRVMGRADEGEVTQAIADFVLAAHGLPDVERARIHVLDTLGLAFAGTHSPAARIIRDQIRDLGLGSAGSAVLGSNLRAPPRFAALANGTAIHADNFDDTTPQVRSWRTGGIHASAAILPTVLALAEPRGLPGRDVLLAYLIGVEVSSRLNHAMGSRHYSDGFHPTGTVNTFGAVASAGRILRLGRDQMIHAIGIAASLAGGVRRNFGSMTEIVHPGWAAENGIMAVDLASRGMTASPGALDGSAGFLRAAGGEFEPGEIIGRMGAPWVFDDPGIWIKPYPCGSLTHPAADCLLALMRTEKIEPGQIAHIRVQTNQRVLNTLSQGLPRNAEQARFSMAFVLALIAVDGQVVLEDFSEATLRRGEIREMMGRITHVAFESEGRDFTNVTSLVSIETREGRIVSGRADHARGSTGAPFSPEDSLEKFRQCVALGGFPTEKAGTLAELVWRLEELESSDSLCSAMMR